MAIDSFETSPPADGAVPARGLSFRALAIGAFLLLLIGIAGAAISSAHSAGGGAGSTA